MKALTLTLPRLGETMEEGEIVGWLVAPGQAFRRGDPILELETDKTVVELPALGDGVIDETLVAPGARIAVGAPIARARVAEPGDWAQEADTQAGSGSAADRTAAPAASGPATDGDAKGTVLPMPRLGETMDEGVVVRWLVAEGAEFARGEALLEIETDKTVAEVPALTDGRLLRILAAPGARIAVGAPLADVSLAEEAATVAAPVPAGEQPRATPVAASSAAGALPPRATPLARRLARQHGLALASLHGSGRRGRIERADVERAVPATGAAPAGMPLAFLQTAAGRLAYATLGDRGPTRLLLHGFAGDHSTWAALAATLARAGNTVVMPDLPAHGATGIEVASPDELLPALVELAEGLPAPLTLVGHSLGAVAAVALAARLGPRQVARVVLLTPAGCGPRIGADFVFGLAEATTAGEVSHLLRWLGPKGGAISDAALAQMAAGLSRGRLRALAAALATHDGRQKVDLLRPLAALSMPVSAVFGTLDRVVPATDALNLPPNVAAHFVTTGHMPQWDAPREVAEVILKGG